MQLYTVETTIDRPVRHGEMIYANTVLAANVLRDVREMITNTLGGKMRRYERLLELATEECIVKLKERARAKGYDGVLGVRISHPFMVEGSASVTVYGTGFTFLPDGS